MSDSSRDRESGYRRAPVGGPTMRTDIIEAYLFRRVRAAAGASSEVEILQLRRAGPPMESTWQPVMGHVEAGERAWECARREIQEETGLAPTDPVVRGAWALEQVWPYYLADLDCIVASPRFAVEVEPIWEPTLNPEHTASRWIVAPHHAGQPAAEFFMWPGQRHAVRELLEIIVRGASPACDHLRLAPPPR